MLITATPLINNQSSAIIDNDYSAHVFINLNGRFGEETTLGKCITGIKST